jgi:haloacid dehalogenase-like hydrolase
MVGGLGYVGIICDDLMKIRKCHTRVTSLTFTGKDPEHSSCCRRPAPKHEHHELNLEQSHSLDYPDSTSAQIQGVGQGAFILPSHRRFQAGGTWILRTVSGSRWRRHLSQRHSESASGGVTRGLNAYVREDSNELRAGSTISEADQNPRGKKAVVGIVFDGDDTLWCTEQLYDDARWNARRIVADAGLDGAKWEELERRIDVANVAILGYSMERFPASCVLAYEEICRGEGRTPEISVADRIRHAARSVFERTPPLVSGASETLTCLRARGTRLALLTKGDPELQSRRIDHSGLRDLFHVV